MRVMGLVILAALLAAGCDNDDGTSESGGAQRGDAGSSDPASGAPSGTCEAFCEQLSKAQCESFKLGPCLSGCRIYEVSAERSCVAELDDYKACHETAPHRCSEGYPQSEACILPLAHLSNCLSANPRTCEPPDDGTVCDACIADQCCVARDSCSDGNCQAYVECADACETTACKNECASGYPEETLGILGAYANCREANCKSECETDE